MAGNCSGSKASIEVDKEGSKSTRHPAPAAIKNFLI